MIYILILIFITIVSSYNHIIINKSNIINTRKISSLRLLSTTKNDIPINCKPATIRNDNIIEKGALFLISLALALISPERNKGNYHNYDD